MPCLSYCCEIGDEVKWTINFPCCKWDVFQHGGNVWEETGKITTVCDLPLKARVGMLHHKFNLATTGYPCTFVPWVLGQKKNWTSLEFILKFPTWIVTQFKIMVDWSDLPSSGKGKSACVQRQLETMNPLYSYPRFCGNFSSFLYSLWHLLFHLFHTVCISMLDLQTIEKIHGLNFQTYPLIWSQIPYKYKYHY